MRVVDLTTEDGGLRADAMAQLGAHAVYPGDAASRTQLLMITAEERARFLAEGEQFRSSEITLLIEAAINTRAGQMALAGLGSGPIDPLAIEMAV